jgi:NAD(P)-dependent dehydrogenase (short-subunit alcohol dehydrogenase family)
MKMKTDRKIALVTGATRGLGLETARQLAARGVHVLLGARNPATGEAKAAALRAIGLDVHSLILDLDEEETIRLAAKQIEQSCGRLDILINNAGIFLGDRDGLPSVADPEAVRRTIDLNFIATLRVTQHMLPLLRKSHSGRIVNVSSGVGSLAVNADLDNTGPRWLGYSASKAALNLLTIQLAHELRATSIKVNSICPGYVKTDMNNGEGLLSVEQGAQASIRFALLGDEGPSGGFFGADSPKAW